MAIRRTPGLLTALGHGGRVSRSVGLGLALVLFGAPALAAAPSCPPGRFFLAGGARVLPAGEEVAIDAVVLEESGAISIASGCPPVSAKVKKRGKQLKAQWPAGACTGVPGKAKASVQFAPGCEVLSGKFSAKKLKTKFTATRSDGVLLEGDPSASALSALLNLSPHPAAPGDIVGGLILTRLDVGLVADATVGQVNAALGAVGGRITAMRAGLPALAVAVPRQDGPDGLQALSDTLEAQPGIRVALLAPEASLDEAPPPPANAAIRHLQTARFPAAWNARAAAGSCADKVTVIVADKFHRPRAALYAGFATQVPGVTDRGTGSVAAADPQGFHGYDVLTTLAAKLDATVPTGANPFPECLKVTAVQIQGLDPFEISSAIDDALLASAGKAVVNASYGFNDACGTPDAPLCTEANLTAPRAVARAIWAAWQRQLLQPDVDQVLVTAAAGNEASLPVASLYPGAGQAEYNSALNVAATADSAMSFVSDTALWEPTASCLPDPCPSLTATPDEVDNLAGLLADAGQASAPPASNVVIVGSSDNLLNNPSDFSEPGADVFAVGEQIPTMRGSETTQGTSFAAPQVAGLAAYLWMLSPELRARPVGDTIDAIAGNARAFPVGLIDAYTTVLSLDLPAEVTPATAPVRLAILDVDPDGFFDVSDLQSFHDAYIDSGLVLEPSVQDFSRFDLNGNGFTGGTGATRTARIDLDPTGSTQFGAPTLTEVTTEVGGEERTFDERAVTDADVLCYYANTPLYTGAPAQRDTILSELGCGSLELVFAGTITETFDGTDGVTTVSSTETYNVVLESKPDGGFETTGSAHLRAVADRNCQPGTEHQVLDASASDPPDTMGDFGAGFAIGIEADVEGTSTLLGTDSCEEDFEEPFDAEIRTGLSSEPELVDGRVVALVWDGEVEAADPFGFQIPGTLRVTGRLERVD